MMHDPAELRKAIAEKLPPGFVVAEHSDEGHFYRVMDESMGNPLYESVTKKLQVLKDEGLHNFKRDQAIDYVFKHYKEFNDSNIMTHIENAENAAADIFHDAGDIGTQVHDYREKIFSNWIRTGIQPTDYKSFIDPNKYDVRAESCLSALESFVKDYSYTPVYTEMMVYSHKMKLAGTLDDLGIMRIQTRKPRVEMFECKHDTNSLISKGNVETCLGCEAKWRWVFALVDLKTSNRFKDHYFYQVSIYFDMLRKITGITPEKCYILKLSKEDRTYKLEDLKRPKKIVQYAMALLRTNEGVDFIKSLRKDNQRNVLAL